MTTIETIPFANARVRVKRDVLFTETEEGVLFHNAHGGFQMKGRSAYRFASLIVPHLNGEVSLRELCEHLPEQHHSMVSGLVRMLLERGLARDVLPHDAPEAVGLEPEVARQFAAQLDYIDHYEDRAAKRFLGFRAARVAILGDDAVAGWCALSLLRNGSAAVTVHGPVHVFSQAEAEAAELAAQGVPAQVERLSASRGPVSWSDLADFDLVICAGSGAPGQTLQLLSGDGVPSGKRLLPVTMYGERVVVGPLSGGDGTACWSCAMLRLGFNGDEAAAADVWRAAATGTDGAGPRPGRHLSAIIGNLLGYEAFKEFSGVLPAETENAVIVQDTASFDTVVSKVLPHPLCSFCGTHQTHEAPAGGGRPTALTVPVESRVPDPEAPEEADEAVAELDRLTKAFVSSVSGVFNEFDDEWPTQLPLKVSRLEFGVGTGARHVVNAFDLHHVAAARMTAMSTAAAEYLDRVTPPPAPVLKTDQVDGLPTVAASRLSTFSGLGSSADGVREWVRAVSLADGSEVLVPAAAVRPYARLNASREFTLTRAGLGVGISPGDAAHRALFSALAHEEIQRALRSDEGVSPVSLDHAAAEGDPELVFLVNSTENLGRSVEVLALRACGATPVLLARTRLDDGTALWAACSHSEPRRALKTALRDLLGQCQLAGQRPGAVVDTHPLVDSLDPYTILPSKTAPAVDWAAADLQTVPAALRSAGYAAYLVADGSVDLRAGGLHAARVLLARDGQA